MAPSMRKKQSKWFSGLLWAEEHYHLFNNNIVFGQKIIVEKDRGYDFIAGVIDYIEHNKRLNRRLITINIELV